jgi:hypothetical protein
MIVRPHGSAQLLVTQPDHAALAGRIMEYWVADAFAAAPRRTDILLAIAEHDNGWREVDAAPLIDAETGRVLDFIHAPDAVRQGVWPRGVERLAHAPYAAALVAQHAIEIYARYRPAPAWQSFFSGLEAARERHLQRASVGLEDLRRDYLFVRAGDVISLTFCTGWRDEQPIGSEYVVRARDNELVVTPDPFDGRTVPIETAAVEVPAAPFTSAANALDAFKRGEPRRMTGVVHGG